MSDPASTALLFQIADQRYALNVSQITEIVPAVNLRKIPGAPDYVAGVFNFRGTLVPVIDLGIMIAGSRAPHFFSTRIVLVSYKGRLRGSRTLGLLVERAISVVADEFGEPSSAGVSTPASPYLGKIAMSSSDSVQFVSVESLIPDSLQEILFVDT